jgi:hypothetical protein
MAKALLGHVGGDVRAALEMRRLQERVRTLESEVLRLRSENDRLAAAAAHPEDLITLESSREHEPAFG